MIGSRIWNRLLKIGMLFWLYTGKIALTLIHALFWDFELPFAHHDYIQAIRFHNKPQALKQELSAHFHYRNDPLGGLWDFYYLPHITWKLQRGDCDDFAWMAADALSRQGLKAIMATLIPRKITESHVIVVYQNSGIWSWAEVGYWDGDKFPSLHDAVLAAADPLGGLRVAHCQCFTPIHRAGEVLDK
jgi:hypothetical protein